MLEYGNGTRVIVRVQWQDKIGGGGHVFIAEQVGNNTIFIDPQTGKKDCSYYFSSGIYKTIKNWTIKNR